MDSLFINEYDQQLKPEHRHPGNKKFPTIYALVCEVNKTILVGSSKNTRNRICVHKGDLLKNIHDNIIMQRIFNKYKVMTFRILEVLTTIDGDIFVAKETEWIEKMRKPDSGYKCVNMCKPLNTWTKNNTASRKWTKDQREFYEINPIPQGNRDRCKTPEARKRMSELLKGRKCTWKPQLLEARHRRPLQVYSIYYTIQTPEGDIVKIHKWEGLKQFLKDYHQKHNTHQHKRCVAEQLIKQRERRGFKLLQLLRVNVNDGKIVIKYQDPSYSPVALPAITS
jgi:hypothetical protein